MQLTNNSARYLNKAEEAFLAQDLNKMNKNLRKINIEELNPSEQKSFIEYDTIRILNKSFAKLDEKLNYSIEDLKDQVKELKLKGTETDSFFSWLRKLPNSTPAFSQTKNSTPLLKSSFADRPIVQEKIKQPNPNQGSSESSFFQSPPTSPTQIDTQFRETHETSRENKRKIELETEIQTNFKEESLLSFFSSIEDSRAPKNAPFQIESHLGLPQPIKKLNRKDDNQLYTNETLFEFFRKEEYEETMHILKVITNINLQNQKQLFFLKAACINHLFLAFQNIIKTQNEVIEWRKKLKIDSLLSREKNNIFI